MTGRQPSNSALCNDHNKSILSTVQESFCNFFSFMSEIILRDSPVDGDSCDVDHLDEGGGGLWHLEMCSMYNIDICLNSKLGLWRQYWSWLSLPPQNYVELGHQRPEVVEDPVMECGSSHSVLSNQRTQTPSTTGGETMLFIITFTYCK